MDSKQNEGGFKPQNPFVEIRVGGRSDGVDSINVEKIRAEFPWICECKKPDECYTLEFIMNTLNTPLDEDTAWGLVHQILNLLLVYGKKKRVFNLFEVPEELSNVCIHRDGSLHWKWSDSDILDIVQRPLSHINDIAVLRKIGTLVYKAIDHTISETEEVELSPNINELFEFLIFGSENIKEKGAVLKMDSLSPYFFYALEKCQKRVIFTLPQFYYKEKCSSLFLDAFAITNNIEEKVEEPIPEELEVEKLINDDDDDDKSDKDWGQAYKNVLDELKINQTSQ